MDSSPFDESVDRGGPSAPGNPLYGSPRDKAVNRTLFGNHRVAAVQPTYDFLASSPAPTPRRQRTSSGTAKAGNLHPSLMASDRKHLLWVLDQSNEALRSDLNSARYELSTLQQERELQKIRHEKEIRALEAKVEEQAKRADAVESDKTYLFNKQKEFSEKLEKVKDQATNHKQNLEQQLRRLKAENAELKENARDKEDDIQAQDRQYRRQLEELKTRNESLDKINAEFRGELEAKEQSLRTTQSKIASYEAEVSNLETELLKVKAQTGDLETLGILKKELSEQVAHIRTLETTSRRQSSELKHLRDYRKSLEILEEEKQALEVKVKLVDDVRRELSEAQLRISILQDEKNSWSSFFESEGLEFDSPESLARALVQERVERASLLEQVGRSNPELTAKESLIEDLEKDILSLKEELVKVKESASKGSRTRARMERQRALALKEAQFYREQLKSFSTEETMMVQDYDVQKSKRIEELEELLETYKKENEELLTEISKKEGLDMGDVLGKKRQREDTDAENLRIGELVRKNRQLQDEVTQLQNVNTLTKKEVASLQIRLESLENTSTRILQLKDNPTSREEAIKVSTLDFLRKENAALLAQIEGRTDEVGKVVPIHTIDNLRAEIQAMEKVVKDKEKRMTRLKEIWAAKSSEFREAVYSLIGYKFDFLPNGRVRVTHMFAGSDDQSIEFDGEKGTMKVAGGPDSVFHKEMKNQFAFWMARQSIPCLLASILIEQYEKTTRAQRM